MAVDKVSTFAIFQSTLNDMSRTQASLANMQNQLSSGKKSLDFRGIAAQSQQFIDLENKMAKSGQYITNNTLVSNRLDSVDKSLTQIIDAATSLRSLIQSRRNGVQGANETFDIQVGQAWQTIATQLNITLEGRYLFSGTATDKRPVDPSAFPTLVEEGVPDASYYHGSAQDIIVRADDNTQFTYNVRADDEGFQKIAAGLVSARAGGRSDNDAKLAQAYDFVSEGLEDIISLRATVNANKVTVLNINQSQQSLQLYWKGIKEEISNADLISVSTQVAVDQGILQATFQAFATINSLRLSDFLR